MRIISGIYGGRRNPKKAPAGVRPTADAVRESIFNSLSNMIDIQGKKCLDIFAGTGAMGFEALSRGASHTTFVEKNKTTAGYISHTAEIFNIPKQDFRVVQQSAMKALENSLIKDAKFDICFLDPPYKLNILSQVLEKMLNLSIIDSDTIITVENSSAAGFILPERYKMIKEKKYGMTKVIFLRL